PSDDWFRKPLGGRAQARNPSADSGAVVPDVSEVKARVAASRGWGGVCCLPRVCGVDATTVLLGRSLQVLKSRIAAQVPPPPVGRLRTAHAMLRVGGHLLLEEANRPVPVSEQQVGERGPVEEFPFRIDLG